MLSFGLITGIWRKIILPLRKNWLERTRTEFLIRLLCALRGEWYLEQGRWELAVQSLHEAVLMAHTIGMPDVGSGTQLAFAKFRLGQLSEPTPRSRASCSSKGTFPPAVWPVCGWLSVITNRRNCITTCRFRLAWADGEPYVYRYELNRTIALLETLNIRKSRSCRLIMQPKMRSSPGRISSHRHRKYPTKKRRLGELLKQINRSILSSTYSFYISGLNSCLDPFSFLYFPNPPNPTHVKLPYLSGLALKTFVAAL